MMTDAGDRVPDRRWKYVGGEIELTHPRVMGILNVTPDSFSDGGQFNDPLSALDRASEMMRDGAEIIDVGGESTRPGSDEVSVEEEIRRVVPVIKKLTTLNGLIISVDTRKSEVAEAALDAGAHIVNDVEASRQDSHMWELVASRGAGYVAMHMQGTPKSMQHSPEYRAVTEDVHHFFRLRMEKMVECGMDPTQVVIDVGIGFGKTLEHNLELIANLKMFESLGRPQLLGVSRKSMFGKLLGLDVDQRMVPSISAALWGVSQGVKIFRVHDVRETVLAITTWNEIEARRQSPKS